ncbi:uncharacterized protein K452DRAFT_290409 [Aplosporella prunicola CBS 121167]|uniref:Uncharacterized protein n=1 Tax=Aplosporella prunicola CBS 121167 TaxID=1176127 RepID=A0A6A6B3W9_9PEZI|nr:uncharacterized protein K452DRAFT_290409 [Aplosporella prunicola CBS 121167]KAF2138760.1 hypothetical protein K452DRAFT_290409 [Aplosporella prunicola CBS 121167]
MGRVVDSCLRLVVLALVVSCLFIYFLWVADSLTLCCCYLQVMTVLAAGMSFLSTWTIATPLHFNLGIGIVAVLDF